MQIAQDAVVSIHYTLTNDKGEKLDSSDGTPLAYLHGNGNLIPGLERELEGKSAGDKLSVKIAAADAYGEYDKSLVQRVPRRALKGIANVQVGMQLHTQSADGVRAVTVTQVVGRHGHYRWQPPARWSEPEFRRRSSRGAGGDRGRAVARARPWAGRTRSLRR